MSFNKKNDKVYTIRDWIKSGLIFGVGMFLLDSIIFPYFGGQEITSKSLVIGIVSWTIGGFGYVYIMKWIIKNKKNN